MLIIKMLMLTNKNHDKAKAAPRRVTNCSCAAQLESDNEYVLYGITN